MISLIVSEKVDHAVATLPSGTPAMRAPSFRENSGAAGKTPFTPGAHTRLAVLSSRLLLAITHFASVCRIFVSISPLLTAAGAGKLAQREVASMRTRMRDLDFNMVAYGTAVAGGVQSNCRVVHERAGDLS